MFRIEHLKIAGTKVAAIFFFTCLSAMAQPGTIKLYLEDAETKAVLKNWKVALSLNDSLLKADTITNEEGRINITKVWAGRYNLRIVPSTYLMKEFKDILVYENKPTYISFKFERMKPVKVKWLFGKKKRIKSSSNQKK